MSEAHRWPGRGLHSALLACTLAACASPPSIVALSQRPAEGALLAALQSYEDGQYADAERSLLQAIDRGLKAPYDLATAHKHLAFIRCASRRISACETAFRAARRADPGFVLTGTERGHPVWGPVYRRLFP